MVSGGNVAFPFSVGLLLHHGDLSPANDFEQASQPYSNMVSR